MLLGKSRGEGGGRGGGGGGRGGGRGRGRQRGQVGKAHADLHGGLIAALDAELGWGRLVGGEQDSLEDVCMADAGSKVIEVAAAHQVATRDEMWAADSLEEVLVSEDRGDTGDQ